MYNILSAQYVLDAWKDLSPIETTARANFIGGVSRE